MSTLVDSQGKCPPLEEEDNKQSWSEPAGRGVSEPVRRGASELARRGANELARRGANEPARRGMGDRLSWLRPSEPA